jgi:hypothetical protein
MRSGVVAAVSMALLLGGCGGGVSIDIVDEEPGPVFSSPLIIDAANAVQVAIHALDTSMSVQVNGVDYHGTIPNPPDTLLLAYAADLFITQANALSPMPGVPFNQTRICPGGGTLQMVGVAAGSSGLAAGDTVTFTASSCAATLLAVPSTMNGTIRVAILSSLGAGSSASSHVRLDTGPWSLTTPGGRIDDWGDVTLTRTVSSPTQEVLVATGASLETGTTTSGVNQGTLLENFRQSITRSGNSYSATLDGTVWALRTFTSFGERGYAIATESALQWTVGGTGPTAGTLKVTGAGNTSERIVVAPGSVAIDVDIDGNGLPDTKLGTTFEQWAH